MPYAVELEKLTAVPAYLEEIKDTIDAHIKSA